jgi:hypothetical protein
MLVTIRIPPGETSGMGLGHVGTTATLDPKRFVVIDETWAKTNMVPIRGWALCGLSARVPVRALENHDISRRLALRLH